MQTIDIEYEQPACPTQHAWARVPVEPNQADRAALKDEIRTLLKARDAVMVSHFYVHPDLQDLAEETGGIVSDSLEMARFGRDHAAQTLVVSGVRFMGETAKMLSSEKTVLMPDLDATCSLDLGCPIDAFSAFCDQHLRTRVLRQQCLELKGFEFVVNDASALPEQHVCAGFCRDVAA